MDYLRLFIVTCLLATLLYWLVKDFKKFVLVYVSLRSSFSIFKDVHVMPGINVLELIGVLFPIILLTYWAARHRFKYSPNKVNMIFVVTTLYVFLITCVNVIDYKAFDIWQFSLFLRWLNGFAVFLVFPLIFSNKSSINQLMNAFIVYSLIPLAQFFIQLFLGPNALGFSTGPGQYEMYSGLYEDYSIFANAALIGSLAIIYKTMGVNTKGLHKGKRNWFYSVLFGLLVLMAASTLSRVLYVPIWA